MLNIFTFKVIIDKVGLISAILLFDFCLMSFVCLFVFVTVFFELNRYF